MSDLGDLNDTLYDAVLTVNYINDTFIDNKEDTEGLQKYGLIFKEQGTGAGTGTITS